MSKTANVKLGNDTIQNINNIQLENADSEGNYIKFELLNNQEKTENLEMSQGNQEINVDTNYTGMSKVIINKPNTMLATNIKKDVNIGGVVGTYEGVILPTYNGLLRFASAPTISLSNSTLTITAVDNATSYAIYSNNSLLTTITTTSVDLSTLITTAGTYTIYTIAKATGYVDSEKSNEVSYTVASGYSVSVSKFDRISAPTQFYYSIDNGVNWVEITGTGLLTNEATQLKFRITYEGEEIQPSGSISSVQAGISASYSFSDFGYQSADEQSENVTLTQNIADIICK